MILTTHELIGAVLGKNISNPWIVIIIAIPLHFFMDHFRHGEYLNRNSKLRHTWWRVSLDILGGVLIVSIVNHFKHFSPETLRLMAIGMFFSILPDFTTLLYWEFRWRIFKEIHDFHAWCHKYPPFAKERQWTLRNGVNDILFSVIAIILLFL
jgi:hypothetical protein